MSVTGLDHDNARSLRDIARALQEYVREREDDPMHGIAESLAEISQNTGRIAEALEQPPNVEARDSLLYDAWTIIAAAGWNGTEKLPGWQVAAEKWRDEFHKTLPKSAPQTKPETPVSEA